MRCHRLMVMLLVAAALAGHDARTAVADGLTLVGSTFPLRNCRIQSIRGGQVVYTDPAGQRQQRSLDEVATLSFDSIAALEEAEKLIVDRDLAAGARRLMQALLAAQSELQQEWIHSRLARIHDARGEYVQAAGHAAAVMRMTDDAYWARLEPVSQPNEPSYPAAKESLDQLRKAARTVKSAALIASINRMVAIVEPIEQRLDASYDGPAIEPGSTVSGISRAALMGASIEEGGSKPTAPDSTNPPMATPSTTTKPPKPAPAPPAATHDATSPAAIDMLLREAKFKDALAACERIAGNPGERDLPQFLFQYGSALKGADRTRDAAVMFVRCGVTYPSSAQAGPALVQAAIIHRDALHDAAASARLLHKAIALAKAQGQDEVGQQARKELASLARPVSP